MKTIILLALVVALAFADSPTNVLQGVPTDQSMCATSDGTYLYQATYTDPGKIVKVRMSDLARIKEYIIPYADTVRLLCPITFNSEDNKLYFVGRRQGYLGSPVLVSMDTNLTSHTIIPFNAPAESYYFSAFSDANYVYLPYQTTTASEIIRVKISDGTVNRQTINNEPTLTAAFVDLVSGSNGDKTAIFVTNQVIRFSLQSFLVIDSRPLPADLQPFVYAASNDYLFVGNDTTVYRYDLSTLGNRQALPSFAPNRIRFLQVDQFKPNLLHIDSRFPGNSPRDPTRYPFQYIRAQTEPFELQGSSYSINATQINQPSFLVAFNGIQLFQHVSNFDASSGERSYAVPIIHRIDLDAEEKEISAAQTVGTEFLTRADFADNSLILLSDSVIIKKSITNADYVEKFLPNGLQFQYGYHSAGIISADEQFAYYPLNNGVGKFQLSDISLVENKTPAFKNAPGAWTDASVRSGDKLYFYYIQTGSAGSNVVRYDYASDSSSSPAALSANGISHSLIYDSAVDSTGNYLYCGTQSTTGGLYLIRFNFVTNTVDLTLTLPNVYYVVAVELTRDDQFAIVATNAGTFKVKTSDLTIAATIPDDGNRLPGIAFDKTNTIMYLSGYSSITGEDPFIAYQVDVASFTVTKTFTHPRAIGSRVAYDSCTNTFYFVGYENFVFGSSDLPSNIAVIGPGGLCSSSTTRAPTTSAPTTAVPSGSSAPSSSNAPSSSAPSSTTQAPVPSSTADIAGDNNARANDASTYASMIGTVAACILVLFM